MVLGEANRRSVLQVARRWDLVVPQMGRELGCERQVLTLRANGRRRFKAGTDPALETGGAKGELRFSSEMDHRGSWGSKLRFPRARACRCFALCCSYSA